MKYIVGDIVKLLGYDELYIMEVQQVLYDSPEDGGGVSYLLIYRYFNINGTPDPSMIGQESYNRWVPEALAMATEIEKALYL